MCNFMKLFSYLHCCISHSIEDVRGMIQNRSMLSEHACFGPRSFSSLVPEALWRSQAVGS